MSERDIRKLLALVEKHLGKSWIEISDWLREQNDIDAIEQRLLAYDYEGVVAEVESAARRFASETHAEFVRSGQAATKWLDGEVDDKLIRFDMTNDHMVRAAQRNEIELVQGLTTETRKTMRAVIVDGQRAGLNPRSIARDIRDSITLTPTQAKWVGNYRRELEGGDYGAALGRKLRDARSDKLIRRVASDGGSLSEKQIDTMVERYRQRQLMFRATTIARTESGKNVHGGMADAFTQAIQRGDVEATQLVKSWIHGRPKRDSREQHLEMDGIEVPFNEPFVLPDGTRMKYPHDPAGGAEHTANCTCTYAVTLAA